MAHVIAGMTMSVDGFVADREGGIGSLYSDLAALQGSDYMNALAAETGAVLMGRRTFEMAGDPDSYAIDYEFQVPIVVVTHRPPERHPKENERLTVTFVTDGIEPAVDRARAAAGDRAVTVVGGIDVVRQLLRARLVDELSIDVVPVFLGEGLRLFDDPELAYTGLELVDTRQVGQRVALRYRLRPSS